MRLLRAACLVASFAVLHGPAAAIVGQHAPYHGYYPMRLATDGERPFLTTAPAVGERHGLFVLDVRDPEAGFPELAQLDLDWSARELTISDGNLFGAGPTSGGSGSLKKSASAACSQATIRALRSAGRVCVATAFGCRWPAGSA